MIFYVSDFEGRSSYSDLKLSEVGQWSFEHLEEEAKIEEAMLATSDEQVRGHS